MIDTSTEISYTLFFKGVAGSNHEDFLIISDFKEGARGHAVTKVTEI